MPVLLIFFLGSQMAYGQVKSKFKAYEAIPIANSLVALTEISMGEAVLVQGQISEVLLNEETTPTQQVGNDDLIVYQERPTDGREVRFREEFPLIFPEFVMTLADGSLITIIPSITREHVIQSELHAVPIGDRTLTGFRLGDTVTVQGEWQPTTSSTLPALVDVTGISGADRATLIAEWEAAFNKVSLLRNVLGFFTLISVIAFVVEFRRFKAATQLAEKIADVETGEP